jgi:meso-butanediol dehydrogenase/(S,S)-butanediol dehydrogenase/diacetyl reductase
VIVQRGAVVTGGGTGIGLATAAALAKAGFPVLIAGRRLAVLDEAAESIRATVSGACVETLSADVAVPEDAESVITAAVSRLGGIDVLVNAAGIYEPVHFLEMTAEAWDRTCDVVLRGTVLCSVAAARHMREQGGGRIVLISSINGAVSEPESAHYSAAKAAVMSLARSMAVDLAEHAISVNAVSPGWVRTPMTEEFLAEATPEMLQRVNPLARAGDPTEIADFIVYLATAAPPFLTGATLFVDGGQTAVAPLP